ncbi:MAG: hypothetical protein KZQ84_19765 [Candidatus Thiodiazotropha sp. (ex Lucinoma borealis)]|nr:hypothetical protein [Candidatus Thiodiazotropha sp. (ex Lucinoma borealis)]
MSRKKSEPVPVGEMLGEDLAEKLKAAQEASQKRSSSPLIRKPPKGDEQQDFFVPTFYDVGTKDSRSITG